MSRKAGQVAGAGDVPLAEIARMRLRSLLLEGSDVATPAEVVTHFGAMQAQDFPSALWAVGLRVPGSTLPDVERAIARSEIVRTWPMRGTLHFVPGRDARWMLSLLAPRVLRAMEGRQKGLGLDAGTFKRCAKLFSKALSGGRRLTRSALFALMDANGVGSAGGRGYHVTCRLAQEGLLCFGPHEGKEPTFVLLDEWVPDAVDLSRDEALAEIARRFFRSHGPATVHDFARWTGLTMGDARAALDAVRCEFAEIAVAGTAAWVLPEFLNDVKPASSAHLLPAFDEHLLGYADRSAVLRDEDAPKIVPGSNGMFLPTVAIDGKVAGLWKRRTKSRGVSVEIEGFKPLGKARLKMLREPAAAYGAFLGKAVTAG